ncbi:1-deoxy-D-xylulose-5-phosphate reductoisomerase [Malaciobacter molluscorum LMG 25693]|uniref:1-deoxy-D-xylulose 5-phosphate reductoisomerase n=1 Tax=Malaciobacter molluscorum LMG 25693 TaxID=870501 RepID=A0A2G1DF54_9BACT|nr:1-deoxy-D-xylulose-5-phosphate reductoisomerase [Malaciobacter molluscorum]AXX91243.1 1-deoxy-D-xylulose 5-phosphate reductoisomerase [Malaciobacter molluscorum LMG 25693]PHO17080.1 1-deoxy-D-xylulose-5-phosphate reductoisomerase [Malaciobacter molluscorum LMG 25693]
MIVLGSTGSIGVNTLNIARKFNLEVEVLVAGKNIKLLNEQIKEFNPKKVVIASSEDISNVNHNDVKAGETAILETIEESNSNIVVNALVGFLGLRPTLKAITCKKRVALANKESLVVAGKFIDQSNLVAIDSEHFGLWYLIQDKKIESLTITASGGSFRDYPLVKLKDVSVKEALNHPNWSMGNKITIDSATMTNKMFELLEAKWLFDTTNIDAIIETKSLIHAMVNFKDGSTTAHIANASMQLPISYALLGRVDENILQHIDLVKIGSLEFKQIEQERYPIWKLRKEILKNPDLGVVLNAANEVAVSKFLNNEIGFLDISKISIDAINKFNNPTINNIDDIFELDKEIRNYCGD